MSWRERQGQQNLILDQRQHRKIAVRLNRVKILVRIFVRERLAGRHQQHPPMRIEHPRHWPQATLTLNHQRPTGHHIHKKRSPSPTQAGHLELEIARRRNNQRRQPLKSGDGLPTGELPPLARKGRGVNGIALSRHKPGIIVFSPCAVKTIQPVMHLILASTSSYRRQLLERLQHPFDVVHPEVDETPLDGESGPQTAERLALAKARAVALHHPDALVIGSDQVAYAGDRRFGKPGTVDGAIAQLRQMRGQSVIFHTGVAVVHARTGTEDIEGVPTEVRFRDLDDAEIIRYVNAEHVLDCAGSAKSEGLGISLLDALSGDDPTALVGLPLIALSRMLRRHGLALP